MNYESALTWTIEALQKMLTHPDSFPALSGHEEEVSGFRARLKSLSTLAGALKTPRTAMLPEIVRMLSDASELSLVAKSLIADVVLGFVIEQLEYYAQLRTQRPLTDAERSFGRDVLGGLTKQLRSIIEAERLPGAQQQLVQRPERLVRLQQQAVLESDPAVRGILEAGIRDLEAEIAVREQWIRLLRGRSER